MMITWITCSLILLPCFTLQSGHSIKKRSIVQFGSMIEIVTGKRGIDFNEYGDYCGFGGSGNPVDKIDRCCKEHDTCYGRADYVCLDLFNLRAYFSHYKWVYNGSDIICDNHNLCDQVLCLCDREAVLCFAKNITDYNPNSQHLSFWGKLLKKFLDHFPGIG